MQFQSLGLNFWDWFMSCLFHWKVGHFSVWKFFAASQMFSSASHFYAVSDFFGSEGFTRVEVPDFVTWTSDSRVFLRHPDGDGIDHRADELCRFDLHCPRRIFFFDSTPASNLAFTAGSAAPRCRMAHRPMSFGNLLPGAARLPANGSVSHRAGLDR